MRCVMCDRPLRRSAAPGLLVGPVCARRRGLLPEAGRRPVRLFTNLRRTVQHSAQLDWITINHHEEAMATANQKTIEALRNERNDALRQLDINNDMTRGLMESLEVSTQFVVALLLKLGGSATLTEHDQAAIVGQTITRDDVPEGLRLTVVSKAVGEAAAQAAVHDVQQH